VDVGYGKFLEFFRCATIVEPKRLSQNKTSLDVVHFPVAGFGLDSDVRKKGKWKNLKVEVKL
jgi:hypothetical protein